MFNKLKYDIPASLVIFFVAIPLCLGIALASGAPLFSGIIAGIVGGIIVGTTSSSALGVSGPAAGLVVIVYAAVNTLGSWEAFLTAVVLAGILQLMMGFARAGFIAYFFPSSVIKGMLTGIGLLIILKQIPYLLGYVNGSNLSDFQADGETTLHAIRNAANAIIPEIVTISILSLIVLVLWDTVLTKKYKLFQFIQGPIVVVLLGILMTTLAKSGILNLTLLQDQLVSLPVSTNLLEFFGHFTFPDFSSLMKLKLWETAAILAIVASLETLLCVEATDRLDPNKRVTPANRELIAQGMGNIISGLCGGLPITQVIVRSSANIEFGAKTKLSAILHGVYLLVSVATIAEVLNMIPLASLASILIIVGYKLAKPTLFKQMYQLGSEQFVPFIGTIVGILVTDLLKGIVIGLLLGIFFTLRHSYRNAYHMKDLTTTEQGRTVHHLVLAQEVSFFNKANIIKALEAIPPNSGVIIDCTHSKSIAYDVVEFIRDYKKNAQLKGINVEMIGFIEPAS